MKDSLVIALVCVFSATTPARDLDLSSSQRLQLEQVQPMLRKHVDLSLARRVRQMLSAFTLRDLANLSNTGEFKALDAEQRIALSQIADTVVFAGTHANLKKPWKIGFLVASPKSAARFRALYLLLRETFDDDLDAVANALVLSDKPELRLAAGRIAKLLTLFHGPSAARVAIAKRLLNDPVPNVAALFAVHDAHGFESKEVVDVMVKKLTDRRELQRNVPEGLQAWEGTVASAIRETLRAEFLLHFEAKGSWGKITNRKLRTWWRNNRARYSFGPEPGRWTLVASWKGKCTLAQATKIGRPNDRISVKIDAYDESWTHGRPHFSGAVHFHWLDRTDDFAGVGPNNAEMGARARGRLGPDSMEVVYYVVPNHKDQYRVFFRLWAKRRE